MQWMELYYMQLYNPKDAFYHVLDLLNLVVPATDVRQLPFCTSVHMQNFMEKISSCPEGHFTFSLCLLFILL